jgi:uncharacterized spore protein YtfJ
MFNDAEATYATVRVLQRAVTDGEHMDPQQLLQSAQDAMTVRRVFGEPIQVDDATILPVAVVGGGGGGGVRGQQGGVGYGIGARPAGVYVIRNGRVSWRPAVNVNMIVAGGQLVAIVALLVLRPIVSRWLQNRTERALLTPRTFMPPAYDALGAS